MSRIVVVDLLRHIKAGNENAVTNCLQAYYEGLQCTCDARTSNDFVRETDPGLPVAIAAYLGYAAIVDILITFGFSPSAYADISAHVCEDRYFTNSFDMILHYRNKRYGTCYSQPIHLASRMGRTDVVTQLVVKYGVDVECLDSRRETPLFYAVMFRRTDTVKALAEIGADINVAFSETGTTPLCVAVEECQSDTVRTLLEAGADPNSVKGEQAPFSRAVLCGNIALVELLHLYGADPERTDDRGQTPLQLAILMTNYKIVRYLVLELQVSLSSTTAGIPLPFVMALDKSDQYIVGVMLSVMVAPDTVLYYHRNHPFFQRFQRPVTDRKSSPPRKPEATRWSDDPICMSDLQTLCVLKLRQQIVRNTGGISALYRLHLPTKLNNAIKDIYQRKPSKPKLLSESSKTDYAFDIWSLYSNCV